ncbi:LytR/AlgR family response regulator transcription factor [Runella sp.]|uniref:LytR/AlgR family response regulator transcription factor n=1 Tax=Runella sp. TaxID=1960881 RepID=UPI003D0F1708
MKVLIIEDETLTAQRLQALLHSYDPYIEVLAQFRSVNKTIQWFQDASHPQPDLIFLDIHLEDDLGFRIIDELQLTIPIIFTTAYNEYTLQAFKVNSIDYLLKPIDADELAGALNKFKLHWQTRKPALIDTSPLEHLIEKSMPTVYKDRFMVSLGPKYRSINIKDVAYFIYEDRVTLLITNDGDRWAVDYSLDRLVQILDPHLFFRVNRSLLAALWAIQTAHSFSGGKLKLELEPILRQEIFVSGDRVSSFKDWLGK